MALVQNPLFSLSATGKFGNRFTYKAGTGRPATAAYSKPTGDPSCEQIVHRAFMTSVSENWKTVFCQPEIVAAWSVYAKRKDARLTAANFFIRSALSLAYTGPAPSFVAAATWIGRVAVFYFVNPYSSAVTSEPGPVSIKRGDHIDTMIFFPSLTINAGKVIGPVAPTGGTFYYQLFMAGVPRSGIISLTQTQAATYDQLIASGLTWDELLAAGITWDDL